MHKIQIDLAAENRADLPMAPDETVARGRAGHNEGAGLLIDGWAEFDCQVHTPAGEAVNKRRVVA